MPWDIEVQDRLLLRGGVGLAAPFPCAVAGKGWPWRATPPQPSRPVMRSRLSLRATYGICVSVCAAINAAPAHRKHREHPAPICAPTTRVALGWPIERVVVIDRDRGQSGAAAADREGFQQLVRNVGLGRAGLVMGLEVSRFARNSTDWSLTCRWMRW